MKRITASVIIIALATVAAYSSGYIDQFTESQEPADLTQARIRIERILGWNIPQMLEAQLQNVESIMTQYGKTAITSGWTTEQISAMNGAYTNTRALLVLFDSDAGNAISTVANLPEEGQ